jgi:hypothetical protein
VNTAPSAGFRPGLVLPAALCLVITGCIREAPRVADHSAAANETSQPGTRSATDIEAQEAETTKRTHDGSGTDNATAEEPELTLADAVGAMFLLFAASNLDFRTVEMMTAVELALFESQCKCDLSSLDQSQDDTLTQEMNDLILEVTSSIEEQISAVSREPGVTDVQLLSTTVDLFHRQSADTTPVRRHVDHFHKCSERLEGAGVPYDDKAAVHVSYHLPEPSVSDSLYCAVWLHLAVTSDVQPEDGQPAKRQMEVRLRRIDLVSDTDGRWRLAGE